MPELAEVEYQRKQWDPGLGHLVQTVASHPLARVFRGCDTALMQKRLAGARLVSSEAAGKQMLFRFGDDLWLGIHLGMTGELRLAPAAYRPGKHDHLVLRQAGRSLVFSDFRMIGRIRFSTGQAAPAWWTSIAPAIVSDQFTAETVRDFLRRRSRAPLKAVLLRQERFPGIGNWMADEILWRAELHPKRQAGSLSDIETRTLWRECRWVCRQALRIISTTFAEPPPSWLFQHRWRDGERCPRTGVPLVRETIGGRTTCWSPGRQRL